MLRIWILNSPLKLAIESWGERRVNLLAKDGTWIISRECLLYSQGLFMSDRYGRVYDARFKLGSVVVLCLESVAGLAGIRTEAIDTGRSKKTGLARKSHRRN
jgi:hypothetical protein